MERMKECLRQHEIRKERHDNDMKQLLARLHDIEAQAARYNEEVYSYGTIHIHFANELEADLPTFSCRSSEIWSPTRRWGACLQWSRVHQRLVHHYGSMCFPTDMFVSLHLGGPIRNQRGSSPNTNNYNPYSTSYSRRDSGPRMVSVNGLCQEEETTADVLTFIDAKAIDLKEVVKDTSSRFFFSFIFSIHFPLSPFCFFPF